MSGPSDPSPARLGEGAGRGGLGEGAGRGGRIQGTQVNLSTTIMIL